MEKTMELIDVKTLKSHYQFTFLHNNDKNESAYSIFIFIKKHRLNLGYNPGNIFLNAINQYIFYVLFSRSVVSP